MLYAKWNTASVVLINPTRAGYTFEGWYKDTAYTIEAGKAGANYVPKENETLYAKWSGSGYTVKFDARGGVADKASKEVKYGEEYGELGGAKREYNIVYNPNYSGAAKLTDKIEYTFTGWYSEAECKNKITEKTIVKTNGSHTIYAGWELGEVKLKTIERPGYVLKGWYSDAGCTQKVGDADSVYKPEKNIELYAKWEGNKYTVTYNANGGKPSQISKEVEYKKEYGSLATASKGATIIIYNYNYNGSKNSTVTAANTLEGWYKEEELKTKVTDTTIVETAGDHILYAKWNIARIELKRPEREGYVFQGWYSDAECNEKVGDAGQLYAPTGNVTLYARWGKQIVFQRTPDAKDYDTILMDTTTLNIAKSKNNGTNYEITMISNDKFTFYEGNKETDKITKTIDDNGNITITLKIKDMTSPLKSFKIKVKSISTNVEEEFSFDVKQLGAIQTIEDLVDLSLVSRNKSQKYSQSEALTDRFKMTRDLDFTDPNSYEDAARTNYGDVNLDSYTGTLQKEMTSNAGFLPIGDHVGTFRFSGVFNGGGHTLSNLLIYNTRDDVSLGLFADVANATIKDLSLTGNVSTTQSVNMGSLVGRAYEDLDIENITTNVTVVGGAERSVGGVIGSSSGTGGLITMKHVKNYGSVSNGRTVAGIISWIEGNLTMVDCHNYGKITQNNSGENRIGGLIGAVAGGTGMIHDVVINASSNQGEIISEKNSYSGGIAGYLAGERTTSIIINSFNSGNINTGSTYTGGIFGRDMSTSSNVYIYNSYNSGNIGSTGTYVSNIIGYSNDNASNNLYLNNVYGSGTLSGTNKYEITYFASNKGSKKIENTYYLNQGNKATNLSDSFGSQVTQDYMKSQNFVNALNNYVQSNSTVAINGNQYKLYNWKINTSNNYPCLNITN